VVFLLLPAAAHAWGDRGHVVAAHIAGRLLTPAARQQVAELLPPGESLVSVATWADGIRGSSQSPGIRPETARWHFVDIPLGKAYDPARDCVETPNGSCIVAAIAAFQDVLARKRPGYYINSRYEAVKFLVHLVADLHQPLHSATDDDFGGNLKKVLWLDGSAWNLHSVWDEAILAESMRRRHIVDPVRYAERLLAELTEGERGEARPAPSALPTLVPRTVIERWVNDANALAVRAYADIGVRDAEGRFTLGETYYEGHRKDVDDQLRRAGVRLARILNEALR
jgi:hypothetical protein